MSLTAQARGGSLDRRGGHDRRGYVLVAALLAMVLIGALAVAALFTTNEDAESGAAGVDRDLAMLAAESAMAITITTPNPTLPTSIGVVGTTSNTIDGLGLPVVVHITRLDSTMFSIVAEAVADPSHSGARRRIGMVARAVRDPQGSILIDPISERPWSELF